MRHITEEEIIEFLETGALSSELKEHLADCESCQKLQHEFEEVISTMDSIGEKKVPDMVQLDIAQAVAKEISKERSRGGFQIWQIAAAVALLIVGFYAGKLTTDDRSDEIIALQSQVDVLKEVSMMNTLQPSSASERLQVVNMIEAEKPAYSEKLLNSLFTTLNTDESPNVRYAAAQALVRFMDQQDVAMRMAESLEQQTDPLIQISLISILMEAQEKHAIKPLKKLLEQDSINTDVKKQAKIALDIIA
ncbi:HEAT repeat domain-containing protein [Marinoscillum pacificum]|uniref:HEAT repeat domain-containing protein n=1 Tax=Marinoscillum pacificum TaxID=392723 RepID=UPI002158719E|nr:HEAT repeat domain-containing protein [Marinoscillum pacificum]